MNESFDSPQKIMAFLCVLGLRPEYTREDLVKFAENLRSSNADLITEQIQQYLQKFDIRAFVSAKKPAAGTQGKSMFSPKFNNVLKSTPRKEKLP